MSLLIRTQRLWRTALLAVLVVSLTGPWVYDRIHVPADFPCQPPNTRLEGDFCGAPIPATYYYGLIIAEASHMAAEAADRGYDPSTFVFLLLLALLAMPVVSTLLLILRRRGGRLRGFHLAALLLAFLPLALLGLGSGEMPLPELWGYWTYTSAIAILLLLEVLLLRSRRRRNL